MDNTLSLDILKNCLDEYVGSVTKKSRRAGKGMYVCPLCGSGDGRNGTGAFSIDTKPRSGVKYRPGEHWTCFSCNESGDIYDLYAKVNGVSLSEATKAIISMYGNRKQPSQSSHQWAEAEQEKPISFAAQIETYKNNLPGSEGEAYLRGRGLTDETIKRFSLGYDPAHRAVSIPYNKQGTYYDERAVDPISSIAHRNLKDVTMPLFNAGALYENQPCFVVQSPLCAISISQVGGTAVAISGTGGLRRLTKQLDKAPASSVLILSLDNDAPGRRAQEELQKILNSRGIPFIQANVSGECKDPNELLQQNPSALQQNVLRAIDTARSAELVYASQEASNKDAVLNKNVAGCMDEFFKKLRQNAQQPAITTGFRLLDQHLGGGLYPGLYIFGAVSSLGKTTFMLQLADQIAAAGTDVMYYSLEMSRFELIAKSISRNTYLICKNKKKNPEGLAQETRSILNGAKKGVGNITLQAKAVAEKAVDEYTRTSAQHLWLIDGGDSMESYGVSDISTAVRNHIEATGRRPVVMIDYLQLIKPHDQKASDKQITDRIVQGLKHLSVKENVVVMAISSLNRANYTAAMNMAAFKESGKIEYGADVLFGLQFRGAGELAEYSGKSKFSKTLRRMIREYLQGNSDRKKAGSPVMVELCILKQRNGLNEITLDYGFVHKYNAVSEIDKKTNLSPRFLGTRFGYNGYSEFTKEEMQDSDFDNANDDNGNDKDEEFRL